MQYPRHERDVKHMPNDSASPKGLAPVIFMLIGITDDAEHQVSYHQGMGPGHRITRAQYSRRNRLTRR
jgi:hypothetical protein